MKTLVLMAALVLAACGAKLDGTYAAENSGSITYTFKSGGKAIAGAYGTEVEVKYEIDGDKVRLITPQGNLLLTMLDDGSLQGPLGVKFIKRKK